MWYFRQSNNLLVFCVLLLTAGFMLQFKVLYNNHQKHLRVQEIKETMSDVADHLTSVEIVANTTTALMEKLGKVTRFHTNGKVGKAR